MKSREMNTMSDYEIQMHSVYEVPFCIGVLITVSFLRYFSKKTQILVLSRKLVMKFHIEIKVLR